MNNINQKGFSVIHVLLMVVVVAAIAIIGIRVLGNSKAASAYMGCAMNFGNMTSDNRIPFAHIYTWIGSGSSGGSYAGYIKEWRYSGTTLISYKKYTRALPGMYNNQSYTWRGALGSYPAGNKINLEAGYTYSGGSLKCISKTYYSS